MATDQMGNTGQNSHQAADAVSVTFMHISIFTYSETQVNRPEMHCRLSLPMGFGLHREVIVVPPEIKAERGASHGRSMIKYC